MNIELLSIFIIIMLLLVNPSILKDFSNTELGRIVFIAFIICAASYKTYLGLLLVVLLISLEQMETIEPMDNKKSSDDTSTDNKESTDGESTDDTSTDDTSTDDTSTDNKINLINQFRKSHCRNGKLNKDSNHSDVSIDKISIMFPNVKFAGEACNPCDDKCKFSISTGLERMSVIENLKPVSSKSIPVSNTCPFSTKKPEPKPMASIKGTAKK